MQTTPMSFLHKIRKILPFMIFAATLPATAAETANALPAGSFAVVNESSIPYAALNQAIAQAKASGAADTTDLRVAIRNQLIARELFRQKAYQLKLSGEPAVQEAMRQARDNAMIQLYLQQAIKPRLVTDADVRAYYDKIVASLGEREYKARVIQVAKQAEAQAIAAQLEAGKPFDALARQHSRAPTASRGGEIDWVSFKLPAREGSTQGIPVPLADILARLKPGQTSAPIGWDGNWYLLRMEQERATQIPAYESVKAGMRQTLERAAMEHTSAELIAELMRNARIVIDPAVAR